MRFGFWIALALVGCNSAPGANGPPPSECPNQKMCVSLAMGAGTGGAGGGGGAAGTGADAPVGDLTGSLAVVSGNAFDMVTPFDGTATIEGPAASGGSTTAPYASTSYDLMNVASGQLWLFADHPSGGSGSAFSTYNLVDLTASAMASANLVVVDQATMNQVAPDLGVDIAPGTAQIVLMLSRAGVPLAGVAVTDVTGGAVVGYDVEPGQYSAATPNTSKSGFVILLNVPPASGGMVTVSLVDDQAKAYDIPVATSADSVAIASIDLD